MQKSAATAVQSITTAGDKAGASMSRKITVPVGLIVAIATAVQWLIVNWPK